MEFAMLRHQESASLRLVDKGRKVFRSHVTSALGQGRPEGFLTLRMGAGHWKGEDHIAR